jgi:uncharacterized membrane protein YgaE (UPF0421/DUF939 family)
MSSLDRITNAINSIVSNVDGRSIEVKVGVNRQLRIALSILSAFLAGIFIALLNFFLSGLLSPWLILILAIVIGILVFFLLA